MIEKGILCILLIGFILTLSGATDPARRTLRVLVVVGGHDYNEKAFDEMLDGFPGIVWKLVKHPDSYAYFTSPLAGTYDVILQYDMNKAMPEQARKDSLSLLKKGKGLVVLHHSYCGNEDFPEYRKIIGGQYFHTEWTDEDGTVKPASFYQHDVRFRVTVEDPDHFITGGLSDFEIVDEIYGGGYVASDVHPLLATKAPTSNPLVGWTHQYKKSRVVTLLLGHDEQAWNNKTFRTLLQRSIDWAAGQDNH